MANEDITQGEKTPNPPPLPGQPTPKPQSPADAHDADPSRHPAKVNKSFEKK